MTRPPGPRGLPLVRNFPAFRRDPLAFLSASAKEYGPVVDLGLPGGLHVGAFSPQAALDVLGAPPTTVQEVLPSRFRVRDLRGDGVVTIGGAEHKRHRDVIMRAFATRHLEGYQALVRESTERYLRRWRPQTEVDAVAEMTRLVEVLSAQLLFDVDLDRDPELDGALATLVAIGRSSLASLLSPALPYDVPGLARGASLRRALAAVDRAVALLAPRDDDAPPSLGRALARAGADEWTAAELRDNLLQLFLAGHDTVSCSLMWLLHLLALHPREHAAVSEEVGGRDPEYADLRGPSPLECAFKEALRLYPTSPFGYRYLVTEAEIGGFRLPPRTAILYSPWVTHRAPEVFEDPTAFRPARFRSGSPPKGAYMPFAFGPNSCVGASLAQLEVKTVVAMILARFDLADASPAPVRVSCAWHGSLRHARPAPALRLRLAGRRPPPVSERARP